MVPASGVYDVTGKEVVRIDFLERQRKRTQLSSHEQRGLIKKEKVLWHHHEGSDYNPVNLEVNPSVGSISALPISPFFVYLSH